MIIKHQSPEWRRAYRRAQRAGIPPCRTFGAMYTRGYRHEYAGPGRATPEGVCVYCGWSPLDQPNNKEPDDAA